MTEVMLQRDRDLHPLCRFWRNDNGATAIEYSLMATLIAMVCIVSFIALGNNTGDMWNTVASKVAAAMTH